MQSLEGDRDSVLNGNSMVGFTAAQIQTAKYAKKGVRRNVVGS